MTIKIINGKRYNTETVHKVASWDNNQFRSDGNYCAENLYVTKKGSWFLNGDGGALSKYAASAFGGGWVGQSNIITALSPDDALAWLEEKGETDAIEKDCA